MGPPVLMSLLMEATPWILSMCTRVYISVPWSSRSHGHEMYRKWPICEGSAIAMGLRTQIEAQGQHSGDQTSVMSI